MRRNKPGPWSSRTQTEGLCHLLGTIRRYDLEVIAREDHHSNAAMWTDRPDHPTVQPDLQARCVAHGQLRHLLALDRSALIGLQDAAEHSLPVGQNFHPGFFFGQEVDHYMFGLPRWRRFRRA